jgi:hypothetical protein
LLSAAIAALNRSVLAAPALLLADADALNRNLHASATLAARAAWSAGNLVHTLFRLQAEPALRRPVLLPRVPARRLARAQDRVPVAARGARGAARGARGGISSVNLV